MPMKMAQPTFLSGPNDKLATVDVYSQQSSTAINNRPDSWAAVNFGSVGSLLGGKSLLGGLPLAGGASSLLKAGVTGLTDRLGITNPLVSKAISALTPIATKALEKSLPMGKINAAISAVGSVDRVMDMAKSGNIMGVVGSVNNLAQMAGVPGIQIKDPKGMIALGQGLVTQGIQNGVPGVLTTLKNSNMIPNTAAMNAIVKGVLPAVIQKGDIGVLKEITTVATDSLVSIKDNTLSEFCKYYPAPDTPKSPGQYQSEFGDIQNSFQTINADWLTDKATIEGGLSHSMLIDASPEFKKTIAIGALNSTNPEDKWLLASTAPISPEENYRLLAEGTTITSGGKDVTTDVPRDALGYPLGVSKSAGFTFSDDAPRKEPTSPLTRMDNLYPAAAAIGNVTTAPVDVRAVAEVERLKTVQTGQTTPKSGARLPNVILQDMDRVMDEWNKRLRDETGPLYREAEAAKRAGNEMLYNEKWFTAKRIESEIENTYSAKYRKLGDEYKASKAIYEATTIT